MPIFHEPDESRPEPSPLHHVERAWRPSNGWERSRLDRMSPGPAAPSVSRPDVEDTSPTQLRSPPLLDRVELIERLKRVKSPTWQHRGSARISAADLIPQDGHRGSNTKSRPASQDRPKTPLLSPTRYKTSRPCTPDPLRDNASAGLEIERPRSALHSGDFREEKEQQHRQDQAPSPTLPLSTSPVVPWHHSFPAAARPPSRADSPLPFDPPPTYEQRSVSRARAISQSSFASFAFLPPTSPLVQQSNNTDLDFSSQPGSRQSSRSPERSNRRHTFSPQSFGAFNSSITVASASGTPSTRHIRKGTALPYQAHQPRRSLTSLNQFQPHSSPQTPLSRSHRPSFSSEASPLHHAPMVGSYEESILRGRMSTTPSRPLNFIAKIGVLGRGQCKSNLKCPPHVAVPFPAVFYSYNTGNARISDDSPSPYVGLVDLENSIPPPDESSETSRRKRRHTITDPGHDDLDTRLRNEEDTGNRPRKDFRRNEKKKRRSTSPRAPPGGSYRIPQQGQLQIVLKNPNKTAVKLFLVPYDLSDMEAGQKTFIRQRSYSAGPIIDMPLSSRKNLGTDRPEAALSNSDDPNDRPILRYLIHLHICCPSKGRFYLYKSIRVVFANRVPDGKERLRNEIQMPEPRYSVYKPTRDCLASQTTSSAAAQLTSEKALRRASAGLSLSQQSYARAEVTAPRHCPQLPPPAVKFTGGPSPTGDVSAPVPEMEPIPFSLARIPSIPSRPVSRELMDIDVASPFRSRSGCASPTGLGSSKPNRDNDKTAFEKLNRGDVGYGGNAFYGVGSPPVSPGAGLLARRLRGLDVEPDDDFIS
ncbi:hypothetical protein P171DRAFT_427210 [Karstenula rhodostoma CBS 690.94]|uniref:Atos-like conserved domain-containing protein n=1 Tax=Karstenula rhodostoma CBS 690.94 TaxID=1392251 RepID=A0A9P4PT90_9PLEO|nr:hypothetical protein P171DRAFT_427210 [Karstenula rhodostoma CBS 690.94]